MIYLTLIVLAVVAEVSFVTCQGETTSTTTITTTTTVTIASTTATTVTVQNQGVSTCSSTEERCLDDLGILICVPQKHCNILSVLVSFTVDADYNSFSWFVKLSFDVIFTGFLQTVLGVDIATIRDLNYFSDEGDLGVRATIDDSQELVANLDELRQYIQSGKRIGISFLSYPFVTDSFHAVVTRDGNKVTPSITNVTMWLPSTTAASENRTCNENEDSCLDEFGHNICVPLQVCDVISVILSFSIDADYSKFKYVIKFLIEIFRFLLSKLLNINLDDILSLEVLEGSIIIRTELLESEQLNNMLDEFRESIHSGKAKVDLMGANYTIKPDSFTVSVKRTGNITTTPTYPVSTASGHLTCLENEETCLDDAGLAICVPESLCDILEIIVTFKIDAVFDILVPVFETLYEVFKEIVARFLNVDTSSVLDIKFFKGSLGVNATINADAASHVEEFRQKILSGGQVEILGTKYNIMPDSFIVKVNKGSNTTNTNEHSVFGTFTPVVTPTSANLQCSDGEESCLDNFGYEICVPKSFCEILEIVVTFKINAFFDGLAPFFGFLYDVMKDIVATFLHVDTSTIIDIKFFEGSLGVNATLTADAASHIDKMRAEIESAGQVNLMGVNYDIVSNSFHVTVKSALPTANSQSSSSTFLKSNNYTNVTKAYIDFTKTSSYVTGNDLYTKEMNTVVEVTTRATEGITIAVTEGKLSTISEISTQPIEEITTTHIEDELSTTFELTTQTGEDITTENIEAEISTLAVEDITSANIIDELSTVFELSTQTSEVTTSANIEDELFTTSGASTGEVGHTTTVNLGDIGTSTTEKFSTEVADVTTDENHRETTTLEDVSSSQTTNQESAMSTTVSDKGVTGNGSMASSSDALVGSIVTTRTYAIPTDNFDGKTAGANVLGHSLAVVLSMTVAIAIV